MAALKKTQTLFLYPCKCGLEFKVPKGKAGHVAKCPHCQGNQRICSLRELKRLRTLEKPPREVSQFRYGIRAILLVTVLCAVVFGAAHRVGVEAMIVLVGLPFLYFALVLLVTLIIHNSSRIAAWFWDVVERK